MGDRVRGHDAKRLVALAAASLCLGGVAWAEESAPAGVIVRPLLGVGLGVSDGAFGLSLQAGLRVAPVLARLSLDAAPGAATREHAFLRLAGHADLLVLDRGWWAAFAGGHGGAMGYGPGIGDNPATSWVAGPELGVLLGPGRVLGRLLLTAELLLSGGPRSPPSHPSERATPPVVVVSLVASL
jgi:hypothetical protein